MDLAEFLLARIAEDEAAARDGWSYGSPGRVLAECDAKRRIVEAHGLWMHASGDWTCDTGETWTPNDFVDGEPDRSGGCVTLRLLAFPYADHEDYRDEWKP